MKTEPKLEHRNEQPYVAVRVQVGIPFGELLGGFWSEANAFLADKGLAPSGPPFIRYLTTDMDKKLDIEVGFPVASKVDGNDRFTTGVFPEGQYAVLLHLGHYDNLVAVTAKFLAWAEKIKSPGKPRSMMELNGGRDELNGIQPTRTLSQIRRSGRRNLHFWLNKMSRNSYETRQSN
jgi:effector-binding domain-containing protein